MPSSEPKKTLPSSTQRRGLAAAGQVARPADVAVGRVEGDDAAVVGGAGAREDRGVDGVADDRGRGGGEHAELLAPEELAGVLVDRAQHAVVGELEDAVFGEHGRELAQRAAADDPVDLEGRVQAGGGGEVAGVGLGVAIEGPREAFGTALGQRGVGLGHEARVGVIDRAGAVARVEIAAERQGGDDDERDQREPAALHAASLEEGRRAARPPPRLGRRRGARARSRWWVDGHWLAPRGRRVGPCCGVGAGASGREGPRAARGCGDQAGGAQREQPDEGDQERDERHPGDQRDDVVVAVQRPVPQQVVAQGRAARQGPGACGGADGTRIEP